MSHEAFRELYDRLAAIRLEKGWAYDNGKVYTSAADRVLEFRKAFADDYAIVTEILHLGFKPGESVVMKATIIRNADRAIVSTGHAEEIRDARHFVNATSALENAETSAIGRALAALGAHGGEFATSNELQGAGRKRAALETPVANTPPEAPCEGRTGAQTAETVEVPPEAPEAAPEAPPAAKQDFRRKVVDKGVSSGLKRRNYFGRDQETDRSVQEEDRDDRPSPETAKAIVANRAAASDPKRTPVVVPAAGLPEADWDRLVSGHPVAVPPVEDGKAWEAVYNVMGRLVGKTETKEQLTRLYTRNTPFFEALKNRDADAHGNLLATMSTKKESFK